MTVTATQLHHVALTVRDVEASVAWYEKVFGLTYRMDVPHQGGVGKLIANDTFDMVLVLHHHDTNTGDAFTETRTGLDHVGFVAGSRAELETWQRHLEDNGVARVDVADAPLTQSPINDAPYGAVLVFRDPDNIQLELFAPPAAANAGAS
jgi:catechol 2,3-dioxygenase-like lactoylglutathione lyase family enzyme